jgi:hypothetical protein
MFRTAVIFLVTTLLLNLLSLLPNSMAAYPFKVGDEVCAQWSVDWRWYDAEVLEISPDYLKIHYAGYSSSYDEWVKLDSVINPGTYSAGDSVWVQSKGAYYTASVLQVGKEQYKVHYTGYDASWDEWVTPCRVFPAPKVGDPVWVKWKMSWYYAKILTVGTNEWKIHYVGWDSGWDEKVGPARIMFCSQAQAVNAEEAISKTLPMTAPSGQQVFTYAAVTVPDSVNKPSAAKPMGVGSVANNGNRLTLTLELTAFSNPVDIYFGLSLPSESEIYTLGKDNKFYPLSSGIHPLAEGTSTAFKKSITNGLSTSVLPMGQYSLYLLVTPAASTSSFYLWYTKFTVSPSSKLGVFTGKSLQCAKNLTSVTQPIFQDIKSKIASSWLSQASQYVSQYKNSQGKADPLEALDNVALASYFQNKAIPFCWAAMKKFESDSANPLALNSAAVCMFQLDRIDEAGRLLDCAYGIDPGLSITHENAAYYFNRKGNLSKAVSEKSKALDAAPENPHAAWDGYHYAQSKGFSGHAAKFDSRLPLNYSLLKLDDTKGSGKARAAVCCNCNGKFYRDLGLCLDECTVSLACFTHICSPRLQCCGGNSPFSLESGLCYPPQGLQVCVEASSSGSLTVKLGGKLGGVMGNYVGLSIGFKGDFSLFYAASSPSGHKLKTTILTTDPKSKSGGMKYELNPGISSGNGLGVAANLSSDANKWSQSVLCELYMTP